MNVLLCLLLAAFSLQQDPPADAPAKPAATAEAQAEPQSGESATSTVTPPAIPAGATTTQSPVNAEGEGATIEAPADGELRDDSVPLNDNPAVPPEGVAPGTSVPVAEVSALDGFITLFKVIVLLAGPFVVARLICGAMRLREYSMRMGLVLFSLTVGFAPFLNVMAQGKSWKDALRFGIDLAGGTNMVFEVDHKAAAAMKKEPTAEAMDKMVGAVSRRINPGGTEETTVRRVGNDRLEVIVPQATPEKVDSIKRRIVDLGSLEFDILANRFDHEDIIKLAERSRNNPDVTDIYDENGNLIAKWRPVATDRTTGKLKDVQQDSTHAAPRVVQRGGKSYTEFLLAVDPDPNHRVTGDYLTRASEGMSDHGPCVNFQFNQRGGYLFRQLTSQYQPREGSHHCRLAIILNEEIQSAPTINSVIGQSGQITGDYDQQELDELIAVLNAGALDVPLQRTPVKEYTVSPLLGADVQTKGYRAMLLSGLSVFVVMAVYYRKLGLVADVCMAANVILLMGVMSLIDATLTLPGLAGVVLTIGMSVDANVLIYERFREERDKGSSLRMTIHNGFHKALATIVDSNLTTLITAVVLYVVGTENIRGFAVSLFIGIVVSMFTALYMGRLLFDIAERKHWLKKISMMEAIGETHYIFSKKTKTFAVVSLSLIAAGLVLFASRGKKNLDIDFLGGSMATVRFDGETPSIEELQERFDDAFGESVSIEVLKTVDNPPRTLVRIRSTQAGEDEVSKRVSNAFADTKYKLVKQDVTVDKLVPLTAATGEFAGGSEAVLHFKEPTTASSLQEAVADNLVAIKGEDGKQKYTDPTILLETAPVEGSQDGKSMSIRAKKSLAAEDLSNAIALYETTIESRPLFDELNTFDQAVALETQWIAITAVAISLIATIAYLWFRFQAVDFGFAAVVAVMHDIFMVLGICTLASVLSGSIVGQMLGLQDFKLNLSMIASYLTIVGYSLNDTIVVFDRIRELRGKSPTVSRQLVDSALNQTLSRTLLTGVTTLIVIFIMYSIGGEGLRGFSFCLFMGIVVGTYSSIFIASPMLVWLMDRKATPKARGGAAAA